MNTGLDILVVEDNDALAGNIADYLEARGHRVDLAADGAEGLRRALTAGADVIVLDLALPRMDGIAVCREVRAKSSRHIPILMLTARDTLDDKLTGFAQGADDYLTKPFALAELAARVEALSKRQRAGTSHRLSIGPLTIDRQHRRAERDGTELHLTPVAWSILVTLAEEHPRPVARSELTKRLWGDEPPDSDALRSHVHLLRQAVDKPFAWAMLETVHGVGFRLKDAP